MMFDWFDEPVIYYRRYTPFRHGLFDYMTRWMDSIDRRANHDFIDWLDPFNDVRPTLRYRNVKKNEQKNEQKAEQKSEQNGEEKSEQKAEQKSEEKNEQKREEPRPLFYSVRTSMYTTNDGVQHIYKEEHDSESGNHKTVETRRIGDKSMTLCRIKDKDGEVKEHESRTNIKDEEINLFKEQWKELGLGQKLDSNIPQLE